MITMLYSESACSQDQRRSTGRHRHTACRSTDGWYVTACTGKAPEPARNSTVLHHEYVILALDIHLPVMSPRWGCLSNPVRLEGNMSGLSHQSGRSFPGEMFCVFCRDVSCLGFRDPPAVVTCVCRAQQMRVAAARSMQRPKKHGFASEST